MTHRLEVSAPSRSDPLIHALSPLLGGPLGRRARPVSNPGVATLVALLTAALSWSVLMVRQLGCRELPGRSVDLYGSMCYSDIPLLYRARGLVDGHIPYLDTGDYPTLEYPVLTGGFVELLRRITVATGLPSGATASNAEGLIAADRFMAVNLIVLGLLFLLTVWVLAQTQPGRAWDALMLAASPCVVVAGAINWDLLPVALTALALLCWSRRRPGWAGVLLGLGTAAKLYPLLLLGPLLLLCWRARRMSDFYRALAGCGLAWGLSNLPVLLLAPDQWLAFWRFNSERSGDFGSIWYVLALAGHAVPQVNLVNAALLVVLCLGIGALILLAPRRPRLAQVAFLVVAAFLITNKVYSPQYVLWLLPLLILARPRWRDWLIFTVGELVYFAAIWLHLDGTLAGDPAVRGYWAAVLLRLAGQGWVVLVVVRDILYPAADPVREPGVDDPSGGVLDQAPDAGFVAGLRARITGPSAASAGAGFRVSPGGASAGSAGTVRWVVQAWLGSRGLVALVAVSIALSTGRGFTDLVGNWDVQHFVHIARAGYLADPKEMAFFPGLPMLLRAAGALGVDPFLAGVLLTLIASALAAWALYRLGGPWAAVLWLFAPTAVFTVVPYTEALFCAAAFWAWERGRRDHWFAAALLAAAACSLRVSGLFLIGALAVMILTRAPDGLRGRLRRGAWLLVPLAVLVGYASYLHGLTGSWTAWYDAQAQGWPRGLTTPWQSLLNTLPAAFGDYPQWAWMFRFEIVSMLLGVVVTVLCLIRRRWAEASWVGIQVLAFSLSYWFFSVNRAVLLWFPLWLLLAEAIERPRPARARIRVRLLTAGWLLASAAALCWWTWMFMTGRWAS